MKKLTATTLIAALITTGAIAQESLVVANEGDYPPFSITEADGTLTGLDVEVTRELCRRIEAECDIRVMEFSAQLPSLISGRVDMIGNGLSPKPERLEQTEFLEPHVLVRDGWLLTDGWDGGIEPGAMNDHRVGSIEGASWNTFIVENHPDTDLVEYNNLQSAVMDLSAGRIDAVYGPQLGLQQLLDNINNADAFEFVAYSFPGRPTQGNSFAVQKGNADLRDRLNAALEDMFADCSYTQIRAEFTPVPLSTREPEACITQ